MSPIQWRSVVCSLSRAVASVASVASLAVLAAVCGGCSSSSRDIRGRDHRALLPAVRTLIDVRNNRYSDAESRPITEIELDVAGADGDMRNSGVRIGEYQIIEGSAAMRFGRAVRDRIEFVGITGLGVNRLEILDRSAAPLIDDKTTEYGIKLGGELRAYLTPWLAVHTRLTVFVRPFDMSSTQGEAGLAFGTREGLGVIAGYKVWKLEDKSSDLRGVDDVDLKVEGLFVGMELSF